MSSRVLALNADDLAGLSLTIDPVSLGSASAGGIFDWRGDVIGTECGQASDEARANSL